MSKFTGSGKYPKRKDENWKTIKYKEWKELKSKRKPEDVIIDKYRKVDYRNTTKILDDYVKRYEDYVAARNNYQINWQIFVECVLNPKTSAKERKSVRNSLDQSRKEFEKHYKTIDKLIDTARELRPRSHVKHNQEYKNIVANFKKEGKKRELQSFIKQNKYNPKYLIGAQDETSKKLYEIEDILEKDKDIGPP